MRYIFFIAVLLFSLNTSYAWSNNYTPNNYYQSDIARLEKRIFRQTFDYDTQNNRIERLERKIFGACQNGSTQERLILLKNASQNYKAYSKPSVSQYQRPIFTGSQGSNWRSLLMGNFMNQFAGTATGFTPTLTPAMDPAMMDYFEAERAGYGEQHDYADNYRKYHNKVNRSTGTGIQILD